MKQVHFVVRYWNPRLDGRVKHSNREFMFRLLATALFAFVMALPAYAQAPIPPETPGDVVATPAPEATTAAAEQIPGTGIPQLPRVMTPESNALKLTAGDFKHFF